MNEIRFTVPGEPRGKGRPRFARQGQHVRTYTDDKTAAYEDVIRLAYTSQCHGILFEKDEPLRLIILAYMKMPQASRVKTRQMLEDRIRPTKKPDGDNIAKVVLDALNKVAYPDDKQIVDIRVCKYYSALPELVVSISSMQED